MLYAPLGRVPAVFIFGTVNEFAIGGTIVVMGVGFAIDGEKALALGLSFDSCKKRKINQKIIKYLNANNTKKTVNQAFISFASLINNFHSVPSVQNRDSSATVEIQFLPVNEIIYSVRS